MDKTIEQLEWLAIQMRADLSANLEITPEDYSAVLVSIERIVAELKPLQDLKVQEQR